LTPEFQTFSCPLTNLHDSHISAPLFGPNVWQAVVQPVPGGGLPSTQAHIEIKLTFKDGGAYDFHTNFERIKERLHQAMEDAGESNATGGSSGQGRGPMAHVNMDAVHLDELPTYQDSRLDELAPQPAPPEPRSRLPVQQEDPAPSFEEVVQGRTPPQRQSAPPTDAPPGYEETQQQSIQQEFEARLAKVS
jgi:WW domain-binding protein 2